MNIKKLLLLITALLTLMSMNAQQVSEQEALAKAQQFFGQASKPNASRSRAPRKAPELTLANNRSEFYVFNDETNGGYVVISGDERMPDVLAYSDNGHFDAGDMPCNMKAWMEEYAEQVNYLRAHPEAKVRKRTATERENIGPLLTCAFSQRHPYNNICPVVNGEHCVTGCVATAMAQIMYYFQWPKQTTGVIPGYVTNTNGIDMPAIPITTIDWDNMLSEYNSHGNYTQKQKDAIATLMLLCGSSVQMDYALDGSGATLAAATYAFRYYWGYDDLIERVKRDLFDTEEWEQMMYDELKDGRPILYEGFFIDGETGHAFILDGYADGYFHINWGWGGDESYVLMTSYEGWREFVEGHSAVIGIQPVYPDSPHQYAVFDNGKMTFYYDNKKADRSGTVLPHIENWSSYTDEITECVIDPSFADIKQRDLSKFFRGWKNLTSIQGIENLNTSEIKDMSRMFMGCSNLTSLDLSSFKTDNVTDMSKMFEGCSRLTSLDVSSFKTDNVTDMRYMFSHCSGLTNLDVSNFKTDNVTDMSKMFEGCSGLTSIDVSGFNTDNVTNMSWLFDGCSGLTSIDVSNFKTDNVTDMNSMFSGCSGLTSLDMSSFNTDNVTDMNRMFSGCDGLASIDVNGFNTANVRDMGGMFEGCSGLTSLDVSGFKTDNVTSMGSMFEGCSGLTSLDVSGFKTDNVTNMGCLFRKCSSLTSIDVSGFKTDNVTHMNHMFQNCSRLTSLDVSGFKTDNVMQMEVMFYGCSGLTNLDVSGFKTDKVTDMKYMFSLCSGLTNLDVRGFKTDNVTDMKWMFYGCSGLTNLDVSGFKTDNVTDMELMFGGCSGLTNLDVSGFKTDNVTNMGYMFERCSGLTSLDVSGFKTGNVTYMYNMFEGCSGLTSLDVSGFKTDNVTNMYSLFRYCSGLTNLDLSGFKTDNVTDMRYMFGGCDHLSTIYVSELWNISNMMESEDMDERGDSQMFYNCTIIVGGAGTVFDENHTDGEYARVDGGPDNPGYFTYKEIPDAIGTITSNLQVARIYDLQGKRRDNVCKGLNIVVMSDGTVKKVMIK